MYDEHLRSGESLSCWDRPGRQEHIVLPTRHEVDVLVVGAGIAGLSVAYHLLGAGRSVTVVDRGFLGAGETARSTAHLSDALDDRYLALEKVHGLMGSRRAAASHRAGIESIAQIVQDERISCAFERVDGFLFGEVGQGEFLEQECAAARRAGVRAELEPKSSLPIAQRPVVRFRDQAQFDPMAYLHGLAQAVIRRGGELCTLCQAVRFQRTGASITVQLENGLSLSARDLVIATNSPVNDLFAIHSKQAAFRSYVLGVRVPPALFPRVLCWDTADPYHYIRWAGEDTLLVGGEDHRVGAQQHPEQAWQQLERWVRARIPGAGEVRHRWSGQILEPMDGLAFIGHNPGFSEHTYVVTGDSGNGLTHGALAGLLLRDLITGVPNEWASLYDPARKAVQLPVLKEYLHANAQLASAYLDWLRPSALPQFVPIPGEGGVIQRGLQKVAVYIDEQGARHECSAVCPHLAGVVHWNHAERSWDCPCHGSRFDPYGHVVAGPARRGLTPLDAEGRREEAAE